MKNFEDFYARARFMDDAGLTWEGDGLSCKWHLGENAVVIAVRNTGTEAVQARISLKHPLAALSEKYRVVDMLTGRQTEAKRGEPLALTVAAGETGGLYLFL